MSKTKIISIFGSTGSIGCNSLNVIDNLIKNNESIELKYLTTYSSIEKLAEQIAKYSPSGVVIVNKDAADNFRNNFNFKDLEILSGREGLMEIAGRDDNNFMINALVGISGLEPTIDAIRSGKDIALANKETLVAAGGFVTELLKKHNTLLFPIDSEHSAILQCIQGENPNCVSSIILTASGGPFRKYSIDELDNVSIEDALNHPNWKMGKKITIDSATMMNKGLEVIEAKWLFDIDVNNIKVLIHPESIIHSMVEFNDGSVKAQLGIPDMKIPIQYSLTFPERVRSDYPKMDFRKFSQLNFEEPDLLKFKCLQIAYDVLNKGGIYPVILNSSNEIAVDLFLKDRIKFKDIPYLILKQLDDYNGSEELSIGNIIETDLLIRNNMNREFVT
ncbi:MAG: 1-deoxy-D-xylulose-5-phosphate reductoisomerase [Ignavibacteriae bacterium]|nr:1-deoxy-D-xylulose-5-phosphate reductoisomerase [Ignavibacteriota bacterium]